MSGIIDDNGVQWEHCHGCEGWVRIQDLGYLKPSAAHPCGLDLCVDCADAAIQIEAVLFEDIEPARTWKVTGN